MHINHARGQKIVKDGETQFLHFHAQAIVKAQGAITLRAFEEVVESIAGTVEIGKLVGT